MDKYINRVKKNWEMAFITVKLYSFIHFLLYVYLICFYINLSINLCLCHFLSFPYKFNFSL